ncbi:MAG: hypothetical protein GFH24_608434n18 [Chloroflexi bacterium AL-N5]|nr:hypothetical protein [Chloroflexi bacterium AL-N5]
MRAIDVRPPFLSKDLHDPLSSTQPYDTGGYRIKSVTVHATGLNLPGHMAITLDGRVLVSEFAAGVIRDVTEPGDYRDSGVGRYAWNLQNPGSIQPISDGRILVADAGAGQICDVSTSGKISSKNVLYRGISHPYSLLEFQQRLLVSYSDNYSVGMAEIKEGHTYTPDHDFVQGFPVVKTLEPYPALLGCGGSWITGALDGMVMLGHAALGAIFDVTKGGHFDDLRTQRYTWGLTLPLGMIVDPIDSNLYVTERGTGVIKRIPKSGGYARFAEPFIAGFAEPSCIRFMPDGTEAYVCDRAWNAVYRLELERRN